MKNDKILLNKCLYGIKMISVIEMNYTVFNKGNRFNRPDSAMRTSGSDTR